MEKLEIIGMGNLLNEFDKLSNKLIDLQRSVDDLRFKGVRTITVNQILENIRGLLETAKDQLTADWYNWRK